jgi:CRP-like cAMP-binding protein
VDEGAVLFDEKARPGRIYVVVTGEIEAVHPGLATPARFREGGVVTGPAALLEQGAGFLARATTPTTLLALGFDDVFDLMEEHFSLVRSAMMFMAGQVDMLLERDAAAAPFVRTPA